MSGAYQPRWLRKQRANREALKNWPLRYVLGANQGDSEPMTDYWTRRLLA